MLPASLVVKGVTAHIYPQVYEFFSVWEILKSYILIVFDCV
jgi:hypothetical protein